ncbi:MAG: hypothetical protein R3B70_36010 [Polyangiaceae bacterium]
MTLGSEDPKARTGVVLAGVHPIEWIGIETCLALLDRLAGADLGGRAVTAFPIVNPDGPCAWRITFATGGGGS